MAEAKPNKREELTLKMVVDEYAKMRDAWRRHQATHDEIEAMLRMCQYKAEDTQAAVEAISEIVRDLKDQLKGKENVNTTSGSN